MNLPACRDISNGPRDASATKKLMQGRNRHTHRHTNGQCGLQNEHCINTSQVDSPEKKVKLFFKLKGNNAMYDSKVNVDF